MVERLIKLIGVMAIALILVSCATSPGVGIPNAVVPTRQPTSPPRLDGDLSMIFPIPPDGRTVAIGQAVDGELASQRFADLFTLEAQAGQTIDISMEATNASDLDPFLILVAPDGREVTRNDDSQGTRNAQLSAVNLQDTGTYTIVATRFQQRFGYSTGAYTLEVQETQNDTPPTASTRLIRYGTEQTGVIDNNNTSEHFTFSGQAGDVVSIRMESTEGDLDPKLQLTDSLGNVVAFNDDINILSNTNAAIDNFILPMSGYYTIVATRYIGFETSGRFTLTLANNDGQSRQDLRYAYQSDDRSKTLLSERAGTLITGLYIGDQYQSSIDQDVQAQVMLTYYLPHMRRNRPIREARLNLAACTEEGLGWEGVGSFTVYADGFGEITSQTPTQPSNNARVIASLTTCDSIDVTDLVRTTMNSNRPFVQFRIISDALIENGQNDAVILLNPRLELSYDN